MLSLMLVVLWTMAWTFVAVGYAMGLEVDLALIYLGIGWLPAVTSAAVRFDAPTKFDTPEKKERKKEEIVGPFFK